MQVTKLNSWTKRFLTMVFAVVTLFALTPRLPIAGQQLPMATTQGSNAPDTPEQLQQLVAPIALYPDELVAEILAASTYPTEVVQADRWLQENSQLQGEQLGAESSRPETHSCSVVQPRILGLNPLQVQRPNLRRR